MEAFYTMSGKMEALYFYLQPCQMIRDFQIFFTDGLGSKFLEKQ